MYPVDQQTRELFLQEHRQLAELLITDVNGNVTTINEDDVVEGSLTVDRYCVSGNKIEIGSAIAAEMTVKIDNQNNAYGAVAFGGAEVFLQIGTKDWNAQTDDIFYIPMGYFLIDKNPRKLTTIEINALDRMIKFDIPFDPGIVTGGFPVSVENLLTEVCDACNVPIGTTIASLPNANYIVQSPPEETVTCRQMLQWCAEITGTCAYIDYDGNLRLEWYHEPADPGTNPVPVLTTSNRFSSDVHENQIQLTGIQATVGDTAYIAGNEGYVLNIEGNALLQDDYDAVLANIWDAIYDSGNGFYAYTPYDSTVKSAPYIYPLDIIYFEDANGNQITTFCTNSTFSMNKNSKICAKGETEQDNNLAQANPLTSRQRVIVEAIKQNVEEQVTDRIQAVAEFNELLANALGVYSTAVPQENGGYFYYLHDQQDLEASKNIYAITSEGFVWTNGGWNGGPENWSGTGVQPNGNAIFNFITAAGINVSTPEDEYSSVITPQGFDIEYQGRPVISISAQETNVTDLVVGQRLTSGKIQMVPNENGADFIYVD